MKKISKYLLSIIFIQLLSSVLLTPSTLAKAPDINGGVMNEYEYEEVFFLTGTPLVFKGKATVSEKENKDQVTTTYKFTLTNGTDNKLTRSVVYVSTLDNHEDKGQTTSDTVVKSYSEKVTIGKDASYTLEDYQFSEGSVIDNRPASDYSSGNIVGRKIYETKNKEVITVFLGGKNVGYENFWGATETQLMDYAIESNQGTAFITSKVSDSKSRVLQYEPHTPSLGSFVGGHSVISKSNMIAEYEYDIPYGAGKGTINLNKEKVPTISRLIVPKFRDLANNSSKDAIERLYSLGVFDESSPFFSPYTPMKRYQFTIGLLKAVDLRVLEQPKKSKVPRKAIFNDLDAKEKDYPFIESAVEKGIIYGINPTTFAPNAPITRAQAVTIFVRALGMEGRAPSPGYKTNYVDDKKIPNFARDSVYVATELGLIYGDTQNRFNSTQPLTRAQASTMLVRFLDFLENDLKQNYRDDMLFFE